MLEQRGSGLTTDTTKYNIHNKRDSSVLTIVQILLSILDQVDAVIIVDINIMQDFLEADNASVVYIHGQSFYNLEYGSLHVLIRT